MKSASHFLCPPAWVPGQTASKPQIEVRGPGELAFPVKETVSQTNWDTRIPMGTEQLVNNVGVGGVCRGRSQQGVESVVNSLHAGQTGMWLGQNPLAKKCPIKMEFLTPWLWFPILADFVHTERSPFNRIRVSLSFENTQFCLDFYIL